MKVTLGFKKRFKPQCEYTHVNIIFAFYQWQILGRLVLYKRIKGVMNTELQKPAEMSHRFASKTVSPWTHPFRYFLPVTGIWQTPPTETHGVSSARHLEQA